MIKHGVAYTAANVDKSWIGTDVDAGLAKRIPGTRADAQRRRRRRHRRDALRRGRDQRGRRPAAHLRHRHRQRPVRRRHLVPNTEFGHLQVDGQDGEKRASAAAREREDLSYADWAKRVDRYLDVLEAGLWPDLFIVGGGVSKKADKWVPLLTPAPRSCRRSC